MVEKGKGTIVPVPQTQETGSEPRAEKEKRAVAWAANVQQNVGCHGPAGHRQAQHKHNTQICNKREKKKQTIEVEELANFVFLSFFKPY